MPVGTYKVYGNSITINGTAYTPISVGGYANNSVSTSATYILQGFSVVFTSSASTPAFVMTNVLSLY